MRRDLSERRKGQRSQNLQRKELATHLGLSSPVGSPGSSRSRTPRTVGVFILTRLHLEWGESTRLSCLFLLIPLAHLCSLTTFTHLLPLSPSP